MKRYDTITEFKVDWKAEFGHFCDITLFKRIDKKAQLSLTNSRGAKACQKLLQFDVLTTLSLTTLVYLDSFSCCCVRTMWNPEKFSEDSNLLSSSSSKVIDLGANRKRICTFLLATNSNFGHISYRFRDIDAFTSKIACFPPLLPCLTSPAGGTPLDIDIIYTSLKSAFNGLQFRRWHYFIRLTVVAFQNREIRRNSDKIWPYSSSRSSKVIDLGVNRKLTCDFLVVISSNFGLICYRFRDIDA